MGCSARIAAAAESRCSSPNPFEFRESGVVLASVRQRDFPALHLDAAVNPLAKFVPSVSCRKRQLDFAIRIRVGRIALRSIRHYARAIVIPAEFSSAHSRD